MKKPENRKNHNKLRLREQLFADWYIKLMHEGNAAIKAGYSARSAPVTASRLLKKANIRAYILKRKTQYEELLGFNKSTVLQDLHKIKSKSMQAVPVMEFDRVERAMVQKTVTNEDGDPVGVYEYDSIGAIRALENINKMMGYNEPEQVEDVTPLEKKAPAVIAIHKTYVNKEPDKATT